MTDYVPIEEFQKKIKELEYILMMKTHIKSSVDSSPDTQSILTTNNTFTGNNVFASNVEILKLQITNAYGSSTIGTYNTGDTIMFNNRNGLGVIYDNGLFNVGENDGYYRIDLESDLIDMSDLIHQSFSVKISMNINGISIKTLNIHGGTLNTGITFITTYLEKYSEISFTILTASVPLNTAKCNVSMNMIRVGNL